MSPKVSIIIVLKNEFPHLPKLFSALEKQKVTFPFEVVCVDSGSTDGTWEWLTKLRTENLELRRGIGERREKREIVSFNKNKFSLRLFRIKPGEFGHGKTRNFAAREARGEVIVFLTADARPINSFWLANLVRPLLPQYQKAPPSQDRDEWTVWGFRYGVSPPQKKPRTLVRGGSPKIDWELDLFDKFD